MKLKYFAFVLGLLAIIPNAFPLTLAAAPAGTACSLSLSAAPSVASISPGGEAVYKYSIKNTSAKACNNLHFSLYYAGNEEYASSSIAPTASDYYWRFDKLGAGKSKSFSVTIKNSPNGGESLLGEACVTADGASDACTQKAVSIAGAQTPVPANPKPSAPAPEPDPEPITPAPSPVQPPQTAPTQPAQPTEPVPAQPSAPSPVSSSGGIQAWIYPGAPACNASKEYADGRADVLKPEYFTVQSNGSLRQMTASADGCNGYSAANAADVKAHSREQYATVSAGYANMRTLLASASLQSAALKTLTDFAISSGFTGIELDWEGFGQWTAADYTNYKKFVNDLQASLRAKGKKLMIDAPAIPDSKFQSYFQFKYEDFKNVDHVVVMAYDYQYDYGAGTSVAPSDWMKQVVNWAKARIPAERLVIGIPAYGYHGATGSYNITIDTYEQSSKLPGFANRKVNSEGEETWTSGGIFYLVQTEQSLARRKALVESLGIKSVSVWHLGGNPWF